MGGPGGGPWRERVGIEPTEALAGPSWFWRQGGPRGPIRPRRSGRPPTPAPVAPPAPPVSPPEPPGDEGEHPHGQDDDHERAPEIHAIELGHVVLEPQHGAGHRPRKRLRWSR